MLPRRHCDPAPGLPHGGRSNLPERLRARGVVEVLGVFRRVVGGYGGLLSKTLCIHIDKPPDHFLIFRVVLLRILLEEFYTVFA